MNFLNAETRQSERQLTDRRTQAPSIIELRGVIKSFDVSKGYGIIVLDNGMPDILLSVACLRRGGFEVAYEGARVVVEVLQCSRGLQAFRVFSMDESTALPTQVMPPDTHVSVTATRELARPQVKSFSQPRGVGLLRQRRKRARRFRAYRDFAPVRPDRVAAEPVQGTDGGRGAARGCPAPTGLSLSYPVP